MRIDVTLTYDEMKAVKNLCRRIPPLKRWWRGRTNLFFAYRAACKDGVWRPMFVINLPPSWWYRLKYRLTHRFLCQDCHHRIGWHKCSFCHEVFCSKCWSGGSGNVCRVCNAVVYEFVYPEFWEMESEKKGG